MQIQQNAVTLASGQLKVGILTSLAVCLCAAVVHGSPQCNLGLKLFSVEGGKAVCAPIAPFQCIESCEWINSEENNNGGDGCERSSHYTAFRGRRTFLSGVVLSEQSILLQCCSSLATSVELDDDREPECSWSEQIETVVGRPNVRFERVLSQTQYYRNLQAVRNGRNAVKLRAEVCHYTFERTFCDKNKMSGDDFHKYSLLLMRLQRTKEFTQMKNDAMLGPNDAAAMFKSGSSAAAPLPNPSAAHSLSAAVNGAKENQIEFVRKEARAMFRNRTTTHPIGGPMMREGKTNGRMDKGEQILVINGDATAAEHTATNGPKLEPKIVERFGRRFWGDREEIVNPFPAAPIARLGADKWSSSSPSLPTTTATADGTKALKRPKDDNADAQMVNDETSWPTKRTTTASTTTSAIAQATTAPFFIDPSANERILFNDPRKQKQTKQRETMTAHSAPTEEARQWETQDDGDGELSVQKAKNFRMSSTNKTNPTRPQPLQQQQQTHSHGHNHGTAATIVKQPQPHLAVRRIRYPVALTGGGRKGPPGARVVWPKAQRRRLWPPVLATNATKEFRRTSKTGENWPNLQRMNFGSNYYLHGHNNDGTANQPNPPIAIRPLSSVNGHKTAQSIRIPHHDLRIKKLGNHSSNDAAAAAAADQRRANLGVKCLPAATFGEESREQQQQQLFSTSSGAGGSFASSAEPLGEVAQGRPTLSTDLPKALPQISIHPLERAPQFKAISLIEKRTATAASALHRTDDGDQLSQTTNVGIASAIEGSPPRLNNNRLMECCQQQGPGCRAICRRDVNKEQVRKVMVSGQCPPVTMTGVIQCFPRYYNISSVGKCCAQRTKINEMDDQNAMAQPLKMPNLPLQCLSLCTLNFRLTFAHLACVEHIEHILDCYRQLLEEEDTLMDISRSNLQQQKMDGLTRQLAPFS